MTKRKMTADSSAKTRDHQRAGRQPEEEEEEEEDDLVLSTQRVSSGHRRLFLDDEDDEDGEEHGEVQRSARAQVDDSDEGSDGATPRNTQTAVDTSDNAPASTPRRRSQRLKQKQHHNDSELWVQSLRRTRRSLLNDGDDASESDSSDNGGDAVDEANTQGRHQDNISASSSVSGPTSTNKQKVGTVQRREQQRNTTEPSTDATASLSSAAPSHPSSSTRPLTQQVLSWGRDVPASPSRSPSRARREQHYRRRSGHLELREAPGLRRTNNFITVFNAYNKDTYQHLDETSSLDSFIVNSSDEAESEDEDDAEGDDDDDDDDEEEEEENRGDTNRGGGKGAVAEARATTRPRVVFHSSSDDDDDDGRGAGERRRRRRGRARRRGGKARGKDGSNEGSVAKQGRRSYGNRGTCSQATANRNGSENGNDDDDDDDEDDVNVIAMRRHKRTPAPVTPTKPIHRSPRRGLRRRATGQLVGSSDEDSSDEDTERGSKQLRQQPHSLSQTRGGHDDTADDEGDDDDGDDVLSWTPRSQRLRRRFSAEKQARKRAKLLLTREGRDMLLNSDDEDDSQAAHTPTAAATTTSTSRRGMVAGPGIGSPARRASTQPVAAVTATTRSPILTQTDISRGFASQSPRAAAGSPRSTSASMGASRGVIVIDGYRAPRVMRARRRSGGGGGGGGFAAARGARSPSSTAGAWRARRRAGAGQQRRLDAFLSQDAPSTSTTTPAFQLHAEGQLQHEATLPGVGFDTQTGMSSSLPRARHIRGSGTRGGVGTAAAAAAAIAAAAEDGDYDDFIADEVELDDVNCICGATSRRNYDGLWVQCCNEVCAKWQHAACFGYKRKAQIPKRHMCHECRARAEELKAEEREQEEKVPLKPSRLIDSDSDSDSEGDDTRDDDDGGEGDDDTERGSDSTHARKGKLQRQKADRHKRTRTTLDLFDAVRKCDFTRLRAVLNAGVDVDSLDVSSSTKTPLLMAAERGSVDMIKVLLQYKADATRVDLSNNSALALAVTNGHAQAAKLLLPLTANLDQLTDGNETITHLAAVHNSPACLNLLLKTKHAQQHLQLRDADDLTPLMRAALHGSVACMQRLLPLEDAPDNIRDDSGATLLHLAAEGGSPECVRLCLQTLPAHFVNKSDTNGWTPSLYAANSGKADALALLFECGAVVEWRDEQGSTALHLAALGGHTDCVRLLLRRGHRVDMTDNSGWPPLMYADFTAKFDCVMALIRPKPEQLGVLTNLLRRHDVEGRRRIEERVASIVTAIATQDEYYQYINQFIGENIHLLDESLDLFLRQKGLLTLENKSQWFRRKLQSLRQDLRSFFSVVSFEVSREDVFLSFWACLGELSGDQLLCADVHVQFARESGILLGPLREALDLLGPSIVQEDRRLFRVCNEGKGLVAPEACFDAQGRPGTAPPNVQNKAAQLEFVGRMMGFAFIHLLHLRLPMPRYIISQLLEEDREPVFPDDAMEVDEAVANSLKWIVDNDIDAAGLEITYSRDVVTRDGEHITIPLRKDIPKETPVTEDNKREFAQDVTRFLTRDAIASEVASLRRGLTSVVPPHLLQAFQPQEMTLMLCGRSTLDVREWQQHTRYSGYSRGDEVVRWLWQVVESMSDEEKTLFLQFVTGSTILPPGGFKNLQGLSGPTPFAISRGQDTSRLPTASTCFNLLVLPPYETFNLLRDRVLVAVRFGAQGFTFA